MLSSMTSSRQQESRRDFDDIRRHSLPTPSLLAQLQQAQQLYAAGLASSMTMERADQHMLLSPAYNPRGGVSGVSSDAPSAVLGGGNYPFGSSAHSHFDISHHHAPQNDYNACSQHDHSQRDSSDVHSLHGSNIWISTHNGALDSSQALPPMASHGLAAAELSHGAIPSTSSDDTMAATSFNFTCPPGMSEGTLPPQSYYAHYLDHATMGPHADQFDSTIISPSAPSLQSHSETDVLDAFTSVTQASSLPIPASEVGDTNYSSVDSPESEGMGSQSGDKKKSARRQGVTCDQCRTKHLRCDLDDRRADAARSSSPDTVETALLEMQRSTSTGTAVHQIRCSRCEDKGFVCTKTHAPPSRRYPRPSRSGKRIEQARMLHGASLNESSVAGPSVERINASTILIRALTELRGAEVRITDRVMAGSLSLQLLNCFFAVCHMQAPVIDFAHFSNTFNAANGDPRKMSIMSNGGSAAEGIPSCIPTVQGLTSVTWPNSRDSKIGTPGSTETLLAVLHAWAAHYTDAPIAFGPEFKELDAIQVRLQEVNDNGLMQSIMPSDGPDADGSKPSLKRHKRKQGVACDTCRLRRVRCDVTERPEGMGCSRCEDKRIKCTDTYIQTKRAKLLARGAKGSKIDGSSESPASASENLTSEANRLSPRAWITSRSEGLMRLYRPGDMEHNLRRGKARKAFCHALLNHALSLVHKYDLLKKPSVESVQVLSLLAPLLDNVDGVQAHCFSDIACDHAERLGMSTKLVVDETNRHAVEHMLSTMQSHRVFLTSWCRDSIASGLNRRKAFFKEDRAIEVVGQASFRKDAVSVNEPRQGEVVLSGEMGLTFVIMTMVQIGALSRFLATHIDSAEGFKPSIPSWQRPSGASMAPVPHSARFSARPSLSELRKLERACGAVWNSLDSLMLFFDRCAAKAWSTMNSLQPFRPLGWIVSTKLCGSLLYLAMFRALGERHRANAAFMATLSHSLGSQSAISDEDKAVAASLKALFDKSMQRAIVSCRKTARLVGILLPMGILQTGGPVLKQLFPVAQFLAKIPSVSDELVASRMSGRRESVDGGVAASESPDANKFIDPQSLQRQQEVEQLSAREARPDSLNTQSDTLHSAQIAEAAKNPMAGAQIEVLRQLEGMHRLNLGPYTHSSKRHEVDSLIEGLAQLGYAWDTMDREIAVIQDLLQSSLPAAGTK